MSEIKTLLLLELRSFYGINKFIHTKDLKHKKRYKSLSIIWILLIAMIFTYVGGLVFGLCSIGLDGIVPAYLTVLASVLIVFFGMFSAGNRIFSQKGYDVLVSLPLKPSSLVISRFLGLYIADFVLALVIMLPGIAVYGYLIKPDFLFYLSAFVALLFVPAIPLVISTLLGTVITAISSRMKKKSAVQSLLSVALVIGIMMTSFSMENVTEEQFENFVKLVGGLLGKVYPPALWVNSALIESKIFSLLLFLAVSVSAVVLTVFVVTGNFNSIQNKLRNFTAKHDYKITKMQSRGMTRALYIKEAKRYFSSSIYVTNTIVGPIMGAIMSVALCFIGVDKIIGSLPIKIDIVGLLPFAFSAVFCMMTTTSVSVSMEGKQFWVIKSLPVPTKALLDSKILLNLSLMLPFFAISQIALCIALKPTLIELLWQFSIPLSTILFVVVFGITVNLKFHSFDWEKEETVVKQSLPAALGGFAGFFVSIVLGVAIFFIPAQYSNIAKLVICLLLLRITATLYKNNNKINLAKL